MVETRNTKRKRYDTETARIRSEIQEIGMKNFSMGVQKAARQARKNFPKAAEIRKLKGNSKLLLEQISGLLTDAQNATSWNQTQAIQFARELAWASVTATALGRIMELDNSGGGTGPTCVTACLNEYNKCMSENNCKRDSWFCLCCAPCSLQYMGCIAKCTVGASGGGVIIF